MPRFTIILIKPSHYDDDGYVIQWFRSAMPSNSLAVLNGLALDCVRRRVLGDDVEIEIITIDESNTRVRVPRLVHRLRRAGGSGMVGLVGVQTNQFPRAIDLARQFRAYAIPVCVGGFHVSGTLAMLKALQPELQEALDLGVSLFAGEAEGHLEKVLVDAYRGKLKPVYNELAQLPDLSAVPGPLMAHRQVKRTGGAQASLDAGRGCPFECSFCTIINVQGRASRTRPPDAVEKVIRRHTSDGIRRFFITDDNFARNRSWEAILDRLIELREDGLVFNLVIQVDTLCHKIPGFIDKARRANVKRVYIGLENINPDSLEGAKKRQNRLSEYRENLLAWRRAGVVTVAGYIIGFPRDTPESVVADIETIKRELPVDLLHFLCLTPLPGSEDHTNAMARGDVLETDLNRYDLAHITTDHAKMSREAWKKTYQLAWQTYYCHDHILTLLRRARVSGITVGKILGTVVWFYGSILFEGVDPMDAGLLRLRFRRDRRPGLPIEGRLAFYRRHLGRLVTANAGAILMFLRYRRHQRAIVADPTGASYVDQALQTSPD